jgi:hypothetical protein
MEKKRILALGLAALLVAGLALAVDLESWGKRGDRCADMKEKLGLSADATPEEVRGAREAYCDENPDDCPEMGPMMGKMRMGKMREDRQEMLEKIGLDEDATPEEVRDALWDKRLEDLGLTDESTIGELRAAMKERRQAMWKEKLSEMKEKLDLPEEASEEEVKEALKEKHGEFQGYRHMGGFRGRGMMGLFSL